MVSAKNKNTFFDLSPKSIQSTFFSFKERKMFCLLPIFLIFFSLSNCKNRDNEDLTLVSFLGLGDKNFQVEFGGGPFRRSFTLSGINTINLPIIVTPKSSIAVINRIVLSFEFQDTNGVQTPIQYQTLDNFEISFQDGQPGAKQIRLRIKDFTPSFEDFAVWNLQRKLNIKISVFYNNGTKANNFENLTEIPVINNGPSVDAFGYGLFVFFAVNFEPSQFELPLDQWKSWIEVTYSDGQSSESGFVLLDEFGGSFIAFAALRPKTGPNETLKFHLDSNGDNLPDYTWDDEIQPFIISSNQSDVNSSAEGDNFNGTNVPGNAPTGVTVHP